MAQIIQLRNGTTSGWTSTNPTLSQGEIGVTTDTGIFKIGNGTSTWSSLSNAPIGSQSQIIPWRSLGDGSDGNVTISSGVTTLARDMFYNNLTLNGTGSIYTNGYRIFVSGVLDITAATTGAINFNGSNGNSASTTTGGVAGTTIANGSIGGSIAGGAGATSATAYAGTTGSGGTAGQNGGSSNNSGAAGTGLWTYTFTITSGNTASVGAVYSTNNNNYVVSTALISSATSFVVYGPYTSTLPASGSFTFVSGTGTGPIAYTAVASGPTATGGAASAGSTVSNPLIVRGYQTNFLRGVTLITGGSSGHGGSSGGGDGTNLGGGGGAGGNSGGVVAIYANTIVKSNSTPAGVIQSIGGIGGAGGTNSTGITGGGGGGAGGGGGYVYIAYNYNMGPTISNLIQTDGGYGGIGGNGYGTPAFVTSGGSGGQGGYGGRITLFNIPSQTGSEYYGFNTAGYWLETTTSNASITPFQTLGGAGGFPAPCRANF